MALQAGACFTATGSQRAVIHSGTFYTTKSAATAPRQGKQIGRALPATHYPLRWAHTLAAHRSSSDWAQVDLTTQSSDCWDEELERPHAPVLCHQLHELQQHADDMVDLHADSCDLLYAPRSAQWTITNQPGIDLMAAGPDATVGLEQVFVLLFGVGDHNAEGIYSLRAFAEDGLPQETIIVFEAQEDATRFASLLEAAMDRCPAVCCISPPELLTFCKEQGYRCRLEPQGSLLIPPDHNVGVTDWERAKRLREGRWAVLESEPERCPSPPPQPSTGGSGGMPQVVASGGYQGSNAPVVLPSHASAVSASGAPPDDTAYPSSMPASPASSSSARASATMASARPQPDQALDARDGLQASAQDAAAPRSAMLPTTSAQAADPETSASGHTAHDAGAAGAASSPYSSPSVMPSPPARYHPSCSAAELDSIRSQLERLLPRSPPCDGLQGSNGCGAASRSDSYSDTGSVDSSSATGSVDSSSATHGLGSSLASSSRMHGCGGGAEEVGPAPPGDWGQCEPPPSTLTQVEVEALMELASLLGPSVPPHVSPTHPDDQSAQVQPAL